MSRFKFRTVIGGSYYPMRVDIERPQDLAGVSMILALGRPLVMEAVNMSTYNDDDWHAHMAAEKMPSEFDLHPEDHNLLHARHVLFLPEGGSRRL